MRSRSKIFGLRRLIEHLSDDLEHLHADVESLKEHAAAEEHVVAEAFKRRLKEVDEHIHDIMMHSEELRRAVPLAYLSDGEEGEIVEVVGGRGVARRLADMGFTPSTRIRVLKSSPPGPMLVGVRGARIAIGRGIAMKILVNPATIAVHRSEMQLTDSDGTGYRRKR